MATFSVVHTNAALTSLNAGASTSYLHLSGHTAPSSKRGADANYQVDERNMFDTTFNGDEDEDMNMNEDEVLDGLTDPSTRLTTTGQAIASSASYMRGHGAYLSSAAAVGTTEAPLIRSSLCGLVRKTNKLISVASLKTRYAPEVGDLVVGRITDVQPGNRRWRVDIGARQEANLLLSSINLPGGIQRRKLDSDELEMRTFFKEGDLLVCEVQSLFHDGSTSLHTRSLNYGKLRNGQLAIVNACLIRRLKSHFVRLDQLGLEVIVGLNGVVWVAMLNTGKVNITTGTGRDIEAIYSDLNDGIPNAVRRRIGRILDVIALLAYHHFPISDVALVRAYDISVTLAPLAEQIDDDDGDVDQTTIAASSSGDFTAEIRRTIMEHVCSTLDQ